MKVLGILQNLWVKDPARVRAMMERFGRRAILPKLLFHGGLTGRRLMEGLGPEWCNKIVWEEASPEVGGHSGSVFKGDKDHVAALIESVKPDAVITVGKIANRVVEDLLGEYLRAERLPRPSPYLQFYTVPHPAARGFSAGEIADSLNRLRQWLNEQASAHNVAACRRNRTECNHLTNDQREELTRKAMVMIYGQPTEILGEEPDL